MPSEKRRSKDEGDAVEERGHKRHKSKKEKEKRGKKRSEGLQVVDDDDDDDDEGVWVEKGVDVDGQDPLAKDIPTSASLKLASHVSGASTAELPPSLAASSKSDREAWMLPPPTYQSTKPVVPSPLAAHPVHADLDSLTDGFGEEGGGKRTVEGGVDFFSSLGTEHKPKPKQSEVEKPAYSLRELNPDVNPHAAQRSASTSSPSSKTVPGGPGSSWRMMKLRRTYEEATDSGRSIEDVALERYGSLDAWEDAKEERRVLDEREERRTSRGGGGGGSRGGDRWRGGDPSSSASDGERREKVVYTDLSSSSRPGSRASFRRPGDSAPSTPGGGSSTNPNTPGVRPSPRPTFVPRTSLPSALTPPVRRAPGQQTGPPLPAPTPAELNKLQARVLRAKLMNSSEAEALQREYDEAVKRAGAGSAGQGGTRVEALPVIDGQGRLYDIGAESVLPAGNERRAKALPTHDRTGNILRINDDDDTLTVGDMLRAEKATSRGTGADMDSELARTIMSDGKFEDDLDYADDNAEKLARKKMRTEAMRRAFALNDYAKTKKALDSCPFCHGEDDSPPRAGVIAMAPRAYLAVPTVEELVDGHCYIVPVQHHLTMLEAEDEVWDEVKNFMKCLMQMYNDQGKAPLFWETVVTLKQQKHTFIEVVPLPIAQWQDVPAYFREAILASESDWTQHNPLIDFSKRGGFRRMMVKDLPYFMVQWDYKGEKGYGHVIEGDSGGAADEEGEYAGEEEGRKGKFPSNFAAEIIGSVLDLEPRKYRRPRRVDFSLNATRVRAFSKVYAKYDWTPQLRVEAAM